MKTSSEYLASIFGLEGRVAVVTGGMGKLGTEFVRALAFAGARVAVFDKTSEVNETLTSLSREFPISFHEVDLTEEESVVRAFQAVKGRWGIPTIIVNNAGWKSSVSSPGKGGVPFEQYPMDVWEDVFRVNTLTAAMCAKVGGGLLIDAGLSGVVINVLSVYAVVAPDQRVYDYRIERGLPEFVKDASYGASKAALLALTRDLAVQWGPHHIRVVALSPGGVQHDQSDPEFVKRYSARVPLGRMATTDDLCGVLLFLASDAASYMSGSNTLVDGGLSIY